MTAVDKQLTKLNEWDRWFSWGLRGGGFLACAVSWYEDYPTLYRDWQSYLADRRNHNDYGGACEFLSEDVQGMLLQLPGMPPLIAAELSTTTPVFYPNPLGWYDGGLSD